MTGIVLAGGKSSRIGTNKAFLTIGSEPIIEHVIGILRGLVDSIMIVTKTPLEYQHLEVEIVTDLIPDGGALGGIYTGLISMSSHYAFVVACDMPFLNPELIRFIIGQRGNFDVIVPRSPIGYETLHAVYSTRCISPIESFLGQGERCICGFFPMVRVKELPVKVTEPYDPQWLSFVNINTPEDVERVKDMRRCAIKSGREEEIDVSGSYRWDIFNRPGH